MEDIEVPGEMALNRWLRDMLWGDRVVEPGWQWQAAVGGAWRWWWSWPLRACPAEKSHEYDEAESGSVDW